MDQEKLKSDTKIKKERVIENLLKVLKGFSTGRASPNLIEHIKVESYGSFLPISQTATVSVSDPRTLNIQVWDKSSVKPIEKAISDSNLNLNYSTEGMNIRINIPPLSEERRKELAKHAKSAGEDSKTAIRNIRRDSKEELKKLKLSEDLTRKMEEELQKITEEYNKKIDKIIEDKVKEVTSI